jgi:hypothetical protein
MIIPKSFNIAFRKYKVLIVDKDEDNGHELYGHIDPIKAKIEIADYVNGQEVTDVEKYATFNHELVHAILSAMGEGELNDNERFVEGFAQLLTQYELTKKY